MGGRRRSLKPSPVKTQALSYTNHAGVTYYLHEGRTKTGKPRFFVAKTIRDDARSTMPEGFEFTESINGVVSVRRLDRREPTIPASDLALARNELSRHPHLERHRIEPIKGEIIVYVDQRLPRPDDVVRLQHLLGCSREAVEATLPPRYTPVMKFEPTDPPGHYCVYRMTYRRDGGWSWPLATAPLSQLVETYLPALGTDRFFELF